jgi:hypothetical protein
MTGPAGWTAVRGALSLGLGRQPLPAVAGIDGAGLEDADRALALLSLLGQRVRLSPPQRLSSPNARGLPDDPRPMLPPAARDALRRLDRRLDADTRRRLASILTAAVTGAGYRFHVFDLPSLEPMLHAASDHLGPVERAWLVAGRDSAAAGEAESDDAAPASAAERLEAFRRARRFDPAVARAELTAGMAGTPAKLRADLVASLSIGLAAEDGPLLETCLGDRAQGVRDAAKLLLGRLPGSAAYEARLTQARASLVLEAKGLLRRQNRLAFRPPGKLAEDRAAAFALFDGFGLGALLAGLGSAAGDVPDIIGGEALTAGLLARAAIMDGDHELAGRLLRQIADPAWPGDLLSLPLDVAMLDPAARPALVAATFQPGAQLSWGYSLFQLGDFLGGALEPALARRLLAAPALLDRLASLSDHAAGEAKVDLDLQLLPLAALMPPQAAAAAVATLSTVSPPRRPKTAALLAFLEQLALICPPS